MDVKLPLGNMNEVKMRLVLSVHCSGFSWRDLDKFATIFYIPAPLEEMPPLYPKAKYISPQSLAISTAVAVTVFNESEPSVYGFMKDLQLHPTFLSFRSLSKREDTKEKTPSFLRKKNMDRRTRLLKSAKERREKDLLRQEGEHNYYSRGVIH